MIAQIVTNSPNTSGNLQYNRNNTATPTYPVFYPGTN
jgi:hypothetical protein